MIYLLPLFFVLVLLNLVPFRVLRWHVHHWVAEERQRHALYWIGAIILLLNVPMLFFFFRPLDFMLRLLPAHILPAAFLPAEAWVLTLLLLLPLVGMMAAFRTLAEKRRVRRGEQPRSSAVLAPLKRFPAAQETSSGETLPTLLERRRFLAGGMGLAVPAFFGVSTYGLRGALDDLEISRELPIALPHLTAALEGLRIVQISDIHVGSYLRRRELQSVVERVNSLHPDLLVLTGDLLDHDLDTLSEALAGLRGIRAPLGAYMVLGNHDLYADPASGTRRGGEQIAAAVAGCGIRTLRDEAVIVGENDERLAVMGQDWIDPRLGPSYLFYDEQGTRRAIRSMHESIPEGVPRILLTHHPETFTQAIPFGIGLTLAGHTHGGGQVVLGHIEGQPVGVSMLRFHYRSGLYRQRGLSLYVNRGLGYMGLPIRINCPPEISQFRLTRQAAA